MLSTEQVFIKSENVKVPLNKEVCAALNDICQKEKINFGNLCSMIDQRKGKTCLTLALYLFTLIYYRRAALVQK